jgi:uncharacterized iron-regulated membrane protein
MEPVVHRHQAGTEMNITPKGRRRGSHWHALLAVAGALMLAACASTPAPTASLQAAQQAIATAEGAEAGNYAAGELAEARAKLASADTAVKEKEMVMAERFADESRADAELASAKTSAAKAKAVNDEMKLSTGTLIEEMERSSGATP